MNGSVLKLVSAFIPSVHHYEFMASPGLEIMLVVLVSYNHWQNCVHLACTHTHTHTHKHTLGVVVYVCVILLCLFYLSPAMCCKAVPAINEP